MIEFERIGQIFSLSDIQTPDWMKEQSQNPFVLKLDDRIRVFFNCRPHKDPDGKNRSLIGYVDMDPDQDFMVLGISEEPVLNWGGIGEFDQHGVMAGSCLRVNDVIHMYYVGWTRLQAVPYNWVIGLAVSHDNGLTFERVGRGPIMGATPKEPYLQAGCSTTIQVGDKYYMWYTSGVAWVDADPKPESVYQIMMASSDDGIHWDRDGRVLIPEVIENEAQASPSVFQHGGRWHMIFSYRHTVDFRNKERGYRLGYASSDDMNNWTRDDSKLNFDVAESGWDSEMVCYPHVSELNGELYLFYCGNDFGLHGFGAAKIKMD